MSEHVGILVDRLMTSSPSGNSMDITGICRPSKALSSKERAPACGISEQNVPNLAKFNCNALMVTGQDAVHDTSDSNGEDMDGNMAECRICQEEDELSNLESPCACSGSLKFAHRPCVQRWCNEKGDTVCEICRKPFESGYTAPHAVHPESMSINIGGNWDIASGQQLNLQPRLYVAEHHFLEADYDDYAGANARSAACFRSVALMLMALLLLRHILSMTAAGADEDASTFFTLFLLRAAGFLLPCYILARAMNVLQNRRQRQESVMAAAEVAYLIQTGQARGVRIAVSSPGVTL